MAPTQVSIRSRVRVELPPACCFWRLACTPQCNVRQQWSFTQFRGRERQPASSGSIWGSAAICRFELCQRRTACLGVGGRWCGQGPSHNPIPRRSRLVSFGRGAGESKGYRAKNRETQQDRHPSKNAQELAHRRCLSVGTGTVIMNAVKHQSLGGNRERNLEPDV